MDIKPIKHNKCYIEDMDDIDSLMQHVLLRDNQFDQEKEHIWMIGIN